MNKSLLSASLLLLLLIPQSALSQTYNASLASPKRGLVYVTPKNSQDNNQWTSPKNSLTWYYNYTPNPTNALKSSPNLQFIPMLFGQPSSGSNFTSTVQSLISNGQNITHVLAFNEPDGCSNGGSCLTAANAASIWKSQIEPLKALGLQLGAPAVTGAPSGFVWLQNFFSACAGACSADFLPIHWYGNFEGLASHVGHVNATYGANMTAWVTEFADPGASLGDSQSFYNQSVRFLDSWDYVERYSYFGAFRSSVSNVGVNAAMLDQTGQLTDIGAWYLGEDATGNVPKSEGMRLKQLPRWAVLQFAVMMIMVSL